MHQTSPENGSPPILTRPADGDAADVDRARPLPGFREWLPAESLFQQLFEASPDGGIVTDETGRMVLVNAQAERLFGYSREELIGQPVHMLVPPGAREKHPQQVGEYVRHPRVRMMGAGGTFAAVRKDDSVFPVEISLAPFVTEQGTMVLSSIRDVTEQRRLVREVEANLEAQRTTAQILRMSLEAVPLETLLERTLPLLFSVSWLELEPQGALFLLDEQADMLTLVAHCGMAPETVAQCRRVPVGTCLCGRAASSREIVFAAGEDVPHTARTTDSSPHVHYCVPLVTAGRLLGVLNLYPRREHRRRPETDAFLASVADLLAGVVQRKQVEAAFQDSEERFALAVRGTDAGIWDWDLRTNRVYFSPRWKSILGHAPDEITDDFAEWETRLHPEDRARALQTVREYLEGRAREYELEHRLRHKDGSYRWILARGAAVRDAAGRLYRMAGSHLDITERRKAEDSLRETYLQLVGAQKVQQGLLPQTPPKISWLDLAGVCHPAQHTAGDYFDFLPLRDGSLGLLVADVMGKGLGPALLMATMHAYLGALAELGVPLEQMATLANAMLGRQTADGEFITLLLCRLDPRTDALTYVNAGHPPGFVLDAHGAVKAVLGEGSFPLGIVPDEEYWLGPKVPLAVGDTVLLVTDGLLEAESRDGETAFGAQRALDVLSANRHRPARELIELLCAAVRDFTGRDTQRDDLTLVVGKVTDLPPASPAI